MPLNCPHAGPWCAVPGYPAHQQRACKLLPFAGLKTLDWACEKCSGKDDGTSIVSLTLNRELADAFVGDPKPETLRALAIRSAKAGADTLLFAVTHRGMPKPDAYALATECFPDNADVEARIDEAVPGTDKAVPCAECGS